MACERNERWARSFFPDCDFVRRSGSNIGGLGLVFIIGVAVIGLGIVIMIVQAIRRPAFFRGESLSLDAPASVRPKR